MVSETYLPPARLLAASRWAALAVVHEGAPAAAMTSYALAPDGTALYVHLSQMALHTRALLEEPRAAFVVSAPDTGEGDPQTLPAPLARRRRPRARPGDAGVRGGPGRLRRAAFRPPTSASPSPTSSSSASSRPRPAGSAASAGRSG